MIENEVAAVNFIFKGGNTVINLLLNMNFSQTHIVPFLFSVEKILAFHQNVIQFA